MCAIINWLLFEDKYEIFITFAPYSNMFLLIMINL